MRSTPASPGPIGHYTPHHGGLADVSDVHDEVMDSAGRYEARLQRCRAGRSRRPRWPRRPASKSRDRGAPPKHWRSQSTRVRRELDWHGSARDRRGGDGEGHLRAEKARRAKSRFRSSPPGADPWRWGASHVEGPRPTAGSAARLARLRVGRRPGAVRSAGDRRLRRARPHHFDVPGISLAIVKDDKVVVTRATESASWAHRSQWTPAPCSASPRTRRSSRRRPSACWSKRARSNGTRRSCAICPGSSCPTRMSRAR